MQEENEDGDKKIRESKEHLTILNLVFLKKITEKIP